MSDSNVLSCKIVLLGESGVGKTCIISRYINQVFEGNTISTNGASYASKTLKFEDYDKSLKVEIWDTAGQEKYRSLTKFFYKDAAIAVLVYDITRRDSFEEVKNYWYEQLKTCGEKNIVIGLAGNKCDMFDKEAVTEEEAKNFANEIGAQFQLTSAFKNMGIDDLFRMVGCKFLDPNFQDKINEEPKEQTKNITLNSNTQKKKKDKKRC